MRADSALAFTYSVHTNRPDTIAVKRWNSRAEVFMANGEIRMDNMAGEPLRCCAVLRVTLPNQFGFYPEYEKGISSLLFLDDGRLVLTISKNSSLRTAMNAATFSVDTRGASLHSVTKSGDGTVSFVNLGDGPRIEGFSTRHIRLVHTYKYGMTTGEFEDREVRTDTSDIWISKDLRVDSASAAAWARTFGAVGYFSSPRLRDAFEPYVREIGCTGIPLRIVSRMYAKADSGFRRVSRAADTIEVKVSNIRAVAPDTGRFGPGRNNVIATDYGVDYPTTSAKMLWENYRQPSASGFRCGTQRATKP